MIDRSKIRVSRLTLGLLAALAAAPAFAQSTSASLGGRVVADDGQPVANAEVVIVHAPSGTVSRTTTDASGRYVSRGLRVGGPYTITVQAPGFQSTAQEDIYAQLAETSTVNVSLATESATTLEAITVVGTGASDIFGSERIGTGTNVTREQIESLPSIERNIQDYIRLDPRIAQVDKTRGEISAGGQNTRFNNIRIDGVSTNDSFGLESNNLPTQRQPISLDAIEEINISLVNYDVSLGQYTGASVDAVTKSGTNDFSGSVYGTYTEQGWFGDLNDAEFNRFEDETNVGATFGGPLIRDRLFFFAAYEKFERTAQAPGFGPQGSGSAQEVQGITQADINRIQQVASGYGFDAGSFTPPAQLNQEIEDILLKVDWNITDDHRASLRYNSTEQEDPNLRNLNSNNLSLSSHWDVSIKSFDSIVGQLYSDWSDNFSTEFKVSHSEQEAAFNLGSRLPQVRVCLGPNDNDCSRSVRIGTEQFRHINQIDNSTFSAFGAGNLFLGDHEIKFGADYQSIDVFNLFGRDQFGVYDFRGIDAFEAGTPDFFAVRYPIDGDINSIAATYKQSNLGVFVQDTWRPTYNLTLTMGVRYDRPSVDRDPAFNQTASEIFGYRNDVSIDGNGLFQPRFGFNYTFDGDLQSQLRGGIGLFSGAAANVWLANPYQNNGGITLGEFQARGSAAAAVGFSPDPDNQPGSRIQPGSGQVGGPLDLVDPDLRQPAVWKANLAFDHELPFYGVVASAELLLTRVKEGIYYEHLNLGEATGFLPDGRASYWNNANTLDPDFGFRANNRGLTRANSDPRFSDVLLARPTSKGMGQQLTMSLTKPLEDNWFWTAAYTYTRATDVNALTSSQSASNWGNQFSTNPNEDVSTNSIYAIKDRFTAQLGYRTQFFGDNDTTFAMFYEGRSGRPYSYSFINDANGDDRVNDLLYVPMGPGDVQFSGGAAMEAAFFDYMARNEGLARWAGGFAQANAERSEFVHNVDLRVSQQLPGFFGDNKAEIWLDILNVGNLINSDWGRTEQVGFPYGQGIVRFEGVDAETGKYIYNFNESNIRDQSFLDGRNESRWGVQVGFRYSF